MARVAPAAGRGAAGGVAVHAALAPLAALAALLALVPPLARAGEAAPVDGSLQLSGYHKALAIVVPQDNAGPAERQLLQRLRVKADGTPVPALELHLEDDLEWRLGDPADGRPAGGRNRVRRAYARLAASDADLWVGRQRIALGTGRLWSTVDLLNPLNPLLIERDEYIGVDALRAEQRLGELSAITAVYARAPGGGSPRWVGRWRGHSGGADLGVTVARYWDDRLAGFDVATQVHGVGLRGELTATRPRSGPTHYSAVLGADYAFDNTLTVTVETYLSTQDPARRRLEFAADPPRASVQPAGTRYAGLIASYEFTPLLKGTLVWVRQLRDRSGFASATLSLSLADNLQLQAGTQAFTGARDSEFGAGRPLSHVQLQWFF